MGAKRRRWRENPPRGLQLAGEQGDLVTTSQAAALMSVSARTFTTLIAERRIVPAGLIGNGYVFWRDEVIALRRKLYGR